MPMITYFYKNGKDKKLIEKESFVTNSWVYVEDPTSKELEDLAEQFELDESLLHDGVDLQEVPRVEVEDGVLYIYTRYVQGRGDQIDTVPMLLILKKEAIITISPEPFPKLSDFLNSKMEFSTAKKVQFLIRLFNRIDGTYNDFLNKLSKRLRTLTVGIERITNKDLIQFITIENVLYDINSSLVRMHSIFSTLHSGRMLKLTEDERDLLEDLSLNTGQLIQITKESLQSIVNIREAYSTIMTNNLNSVIKLFTSLTVILTLPTIIGTLYGMNVKLPYQDSPFAFTFIVSLTLFLIVTTVILFWYKDWL